MIPSLLDKCSEGLDTFTFFFKMLLSIAAVGTVLQNVPKQCAADKAVRFILLVQRDCVVQPISVCA